MGRLTRGERERAPRDAGLDSTEGEGATSSALIEHEFAARSVPIQVNLPCSVVAQPGAGRARKGSLPCLRLQVHINAGVSRDGSAGDSGARVRKAGWRRGSHVLSNPSACAKAHRSGITTTRHSHRRTGIGCTGPGVAPTLRPKCRCGSCTSFDRAGEVVRFPPQCSLSSQDPERAERAIPALRADCRKGIPVVYEVRAFWEDGAVDHGTSREGGCATG